jgi:hypothetical protein
MRALYRAGDLHRQQLKTNRSRRASYEPSGARRTCRGIVSIVTSNRRDGSAQKGSRHVFTHAVRPELPIVNLQGGGATAKMYQVRQVVRLIDEHKLEVKP